MSELEWPAEYISSVAYGGKAKAQREMTHLGRTAVGGMGVMGPVSPETDFFLVTTHSSFNFCKFISIFTLKHILCMNVFYYTFYLRIALNLY